MGSGCQGRAQQCSAVPGEQLREEPIKRRSLERDSAVQG